MRLQEAIDTANNHLADWNNLEASIVRMRRIALQELMTVTRYGQEVARLYMKAKNRIEKLERNLRDAIRDRKEAEKKAAKLDANNTKLRKALLILARKTSNFDPQHRPAEYWRDWALQQAEDR